uniref:Putative mitochondrial ribosomal protein s18a n=1 Tax=Ixodes ricinus TaxID=34613 RepID=V5GGQ9_IXORI
MALPRGCNAVSLLYALRSTAFSRSLRTTAAVGVKEIRERQEDGVTIYEGINVDSPRKGLVVKPRHNTTACPLCRVGLTNLKYTDVLILSQFVDSKGNQLPASVTGLCRKQHKLVGRLVYEAQRTGLMHKRRARAEGALAGAQQLLWTSRGSRSTSASPSSTSQSTSRSRPNFSRRVRRRRGLWCRETFISHSAVFAAG